MLSKVVTLLLTLASDPLVVAMFAGLVGDAIAKWGPRVGLTSHRWAYAKDAYRALAPRLGPGLVALVKAAAGAKHPEVQRFLELAARVAPTNASQR